MAAPENLLEHYKGYISSIELGGPTCTISVSKNPNNGYVSGIVHITSTLPATNIWIPVYGYQVNFDKEFTIVSLHNLLTGVAITPFAALLHVNKTGEGKGGFEWGPNFEHKMPNGPASYKRG